MGDHEGAQDRTLLDGLARQLATRPDAAAYRTGDRLLTFSEFDKAANQVANALTALGVGRDDRIGCLTKQHAECMVLTIAACKIGAVCAPINWRLGPSELRYIVDDAQARLLMVDEAFLELSPTPPNGSRE